MSGRIGTFVLISTPVQPGPRHDYLTRQVATLDATEKGHIGLASYYTTR